MPSLSLRPAWAPLSIVTRILLPCGGRKERRFFSVLIVPDPEEIPLPIAQSSWKYPFELAPFQSIPFTST